MEPVNRRIVKLKNLIGLIEHPTYEDLLFEIVSFLDNEKRFDGEFKTREVYNQTRVRVHSDILDDLEGLCKLGYVEKLKYSSYKVLKHLWA